MKALRAAILAACFPLTAAAAPVELYTFEMGDVIAHLHDAPCSNDKVQSVLREPGSFRAANIEWQGQAFAACWTVVGEQVVVVDETGDSGFLQPEGFRGGKTPVSLKLRGV
jgi:hypothetical protein